jgi:hypothetical protein
MRLAITVKFFLSVMSVENADTGTCTVIELTDAATDGTGSSRGRIQFDPIVAEGNFKKRDYFHRQKDKPPSAFETLCGC